MNSTAPFSPYQRRSKILGAANVLVSNQRANTKIMDVLQELIIDSGLRQNGSKKFSLKYQAVPIHTGINMLILI